MIEEDDLREMRREVEEIRDKVADMSHIQGLQVRADGRVEELVMAYFQEGATETKVRIYLAADGKRSSAEIAEIVERHPSQVTRYGNEMIQWGILGVSWIKSTKVLRHTRLERTIHLTRQLRTLVDD